MIPPITFTHHFAKSPRSPRNVIFITLSIFVLLFLSLYRIVAVRSPAPVQIQSLHTANVTTTPTTTDINSDRPPTPLVSIWHSPTNCTGIWNTTPAVNSHNHFPYALLRDAVIDRRPRVPELLSSPASPEPPGSVRLVLYITTHLSARLTRRNSTLTLAPSDHPIRLAVEYVSHLNPFIIPSLPKGVVYRPGLRSHYGQTVTQWSMGLLLTPAEGAPQTAVWDAFRANPRLSAQLQVARFDDVIIPWSLEMDLGCTMGVDMPGMANREPQCAPDGGGQSNTSVLISGSALYGSKKRDRNHYREVANFAARALLGPLRFDVVAMSVVTDFSVSDMQYRCEGQAPSCHADMEARNAKLLTDIAEVVEEEMTEIGVPSELFERVLLIPACRLGTDAAESEEGDPCRMSKRYGQYHATLFSYAMLAPYFKWAASYDMDEFLAPVPSKSGSSFESAPASKVFDAANEKVRGKGHMVFQWLNFRVSSLNDTKKLSKAIAQEKYPVLKPQRGKEGSDCYAKRSNAVGKSAVRCDVGLGFTIHHPVVSAKDRGIEFVQGKTLHKGLRTWHARLGSANTACDFAPDAVP